MTFTANGNVGIAPLTCRIKRLSVNGDASKTGGNTWLAFSDERLKNIKGRFNTGLKAVMQLQPIRYEYKRDNALGSMSEGEHIGFGAQTLQKVIPEASLRPARVTYWSTAIRSSGRCSTQSRSSRKRSQI
jgi:hypothetical protein